MTNWTSSFYVALCVILSSFQEKADAEKCVVDTDDGTNQHKIIVCKQRERCCAEIGDKKNGCCRADSPNVGNMWYFWVIIAVLIAIICGLVFRWWKTRHRDDVIQLDTMEETKETTKYPTLRPPPPPSFSRHYNATTPYPGGITLENIEEEEEKIVGGIEPLNPAYLSVSSRPIGETCDLPPGYLNHPSIAQYASVQHR